MCLGSLSPQAHLGCCGPDSAFKHLLQTQQTRLPSLEPFAGSCNRGELWASDMQPRWARSHCILGDMYLLTQWSFQKLQNKGMMNSLASTLPSPRQEELSERGDIGEPGVYQDVKGERWSRYRRRKSPRFDLWVGKIPWRREWQPTSVFLPESPMDRGAWWVIVHPGSDMTEQPSTAHREDVKPCVMFLFRLLILDWSQSFFFVLTFSDSW